MKKMIASAIIIVTLLAGNVSLLANPVAPSWRLINSSAPPRYGHRCAYDIVRNVVVLFGGRDSTDSMPGDVWEFAVPLVWNERQAPGPEGRIGHGLCYDTTAHVTILFGGQNHSGQFLNDTWTWNGTQWAKIDSTGPSPRGYFAFIYDSQRQRVILFGGADDDSLFGDTWEWDGSHWLQRATSGPPPRVSAAMAYYDSYDYPHYPTGKSFLFGGQAGFDGAGFNDNWSWDGLIWTQIQTDDAPSQRVGHAMAGDLPGAPITLFGGQNTIFPDTVYADTWEFDSWSYDTLWYQLFYLEDEPPGRSLADMISCNDHILLIGGTDRNQIFHDVWIYPIYYAYYLTGDVNYNFILNGEDVVYAVNFFKGGPPPPYSEECPPGNAWYITGDVNASCDFNGLDITYMIEYFKGRMPLLLPCPNCPPGR